MSPVAGNTNFHTDRTALTVGGFTLPTLAQALIELPTRIEKDLTPHFLWIFQHSFLPLNLLKFSHYLGEVEAHTCTVCGT